MPPVFFPHVLDSALSHRYEWFGSIPSFAFFYRNYSSPINISRKKKLRKSSVLFLLDVSTYFPKLHSLPWCLCLGFIACKHSRAVFFSLFFLPSYLSLLLQRRLGKKDKFNFFISSDAIPLKEDRSKGEEKKSFYFLFFRLCSNKFPKREKNEFSIRFEKFT